MKHIQTAALAALGLGLTLLTASAFTSYIAVLPALLISVFGAWLFYQVRLDKVNFVSEEDFSFQFDFLSSKDVENSLSIMKLKEEMEKLSKQVESTVALSKFQNR